MNRGENENSEYLMATKLLFAQYKIYLNEKVKSSHSLSEEDKQGIFKAMQLLETVADYDRLAISAGINPYRIEA